MRRKAGPSGKETRHTHPAKLNRFVVESENREPDNSSGAYVQMTKTDESILGFFNTNSYRVSPLASALLDRLLMLNPVIMI